MKISVALGGASSRTCVRCGLFAGSGGVWRNEANWRRKWLSGHGGWRFGNRSFGLGKGHGLRNRGGLEVLEGFEGAEEHAIGGIDAAGEAGRRGVVVLGRVGREGNCG